MFLGFTANDEAGLLFQLRTDVDCKYQPPCFIGDRQAPFLAGPELSVDVPEKIAGKVGRFFPSGFVIRELSGYRRLVWFEVENVEDITRHHPKMPSAMQAFLIRRLLIPIPRLSALRLS